jgi:hypothetical protein
MPYNFSEGCEVYYLVFTTVLLAHDGVNFGIMGREKFIFGRNIGFIARLYLSARKCSCSM